MAEWCYNARWRTALNVCRAGGADAGWLAVAVFATVVGCGLEAKDFDPEPTQTNAEGSDSPSKRDGGTQRPNSGGPSNDAQGAAGLANAGNGTTGTASSTDPGNAGDGGTAPPLESAAGASGSDVLNLAGTSMNEAGAPTESAGDTFDNAGAPTESAGDTFDNAGAPTENAGETFDNAGAPTESGGAPTESGGAPPNDEPYEIAYDFQDDVYPFGDVAIFPVERAAVSRLQIEDGSPDAPCLELELTFEAASDYADVADYDSDGWDLRQTRVHARVKLVSGLTVGSEPGYAALWISTYPSYAIAHGEWIALSTDAGWVNLTLDASDPHEVDFPTIYDPGAVLEVGVAFSASDATTEPTVSVVRVDSIGFQKLP